MRFIYEECGRCVGSGEVECIYCGGRGIKSPHDQVCRVCHGTGKQPCGVCSGAFMTRKDDEGKKASTPLG